MKHSTNNGNKKTRSCSNIPTILHIENHAKQTALHVAFSIKDKYVIRRLLQFGCKYNDAISQEFIKRSRTVCEIVREWQGDEMDSDESENDYYLTDIELEQETFLQFPIVEEVAKVEKVAKVRIVDAIEALEEEFLKLEE
jgi:hypothetical protein